MSEHRSARHTQRLEMVLWSFSHLADTPWSAALWQLAVALLAGTLAGYAVGSCLQDSRSNEGFQPACLTWPRADLRLILASSLKCSYHGHTERTGREDFLEEGTCTGSRHFWAARMCGARPWHTTAQQL